MERHDDDCPADIVAHIAAIEAGWTLRKPWKAHDEEAAEAENREEIAQMLARWREHGIDVSRG
jgi:hypothetical protein